MGRPSDKQQPDLSARSTPDSGSDSVAPPSNPRPAFEEVVMHPSPSDVKRMTAQRRNPMIQPAASPGNDNGKPKRRVWSSVEEFPSKRSRQSSQSSQSSQSPQFPQSSQSPQSSPTSPPQAPPSSSQSPAMLPDPWQSQAPQAPQAPQAVSSPPTAPAAPTITTQTPQSSQIPTVSPAPPSSPSTPSSPTPEQVSSTTAQGSGHYPPKPPSNSSSTASSSTSKKARYSDKTERIVAWSNLLRSLQPFIWAAVILVVVVPLVGKALLFYSSTTPVQQTVKPLTEVMVPAIPRRGNMDKALVEAVQTAHESAQAFAQDELDDWEFQLEGRVDHFLDWYFGYLNQKKMEFMTPLVWVSSAAIHKVNPTQMKANEAVMTRFTGEFQKQFAKQVLVPRTAQIQLENLTTETVNHYLLALRQNMDQVQVKYRIPQGQWDRYLSDISTTIQDTEGNLSNLSLKMLVGGSGYLLTKPLVLATVTKIGTKVSSKMAGTAAAKLAAKTGGTVAAELGTSLVDPIVGVGIFIWDIWDYQHTVDLERPLLKENLVDYLQGVERSLLNDPETGVLSAIAQLEQGLFQSL